MRDAHNYLILNDIDIPATDEIAEPSPEPALQTHEHDNLCEVAKRFFGYAPSRLAYGLITTGNIIIRTSIIKQLSTSALAGNQACFSFEIILYASLYSTLSAVQPRMTTAISHADATGQKAPVGVVFRSSLANTALLLPLVVGVCFMAEPYMHWTGQPPIAAESARDFFETAFPAFMMDFLIEAQNNSLLAFKKIRETSILSFFNTALSLGMSYLFVLGKAGFPEMEFKGLGFAFIGAKALTLLTQTAYLMLNPSLREYNLYIPKKLMPWVDYQIMKQLMKKGAMAGLQGILMCGAELYNTTVMGQKGENALIARQTASQFVVAMALPEMAMSDVIQLMTSEAVGNRNPVYRHNIAIFGLSTAIGFAVIIGAVLSLLREVLCQLMLDKNEAAFSTATHLVVLGACAETIAAVRMSASAMLYGQLDMQYPLIFGFSFMCVLSAIMTYCFRDQSVEVLYGSQLVGSALAALGMAGRMCYVNSQPIPEHPHPIESRSRAHSNTTMPLLSAMRQRNSANNLLEELNTSVVNTPDPSPRSFSWA